MMSTFNTKSPGFAAVTLLLFLPLICALLFSIGFIGHLIQHKTKLRSTCITEVTQIQKNLIQNEQDLFKLNPLARALRLQLRLAYIELAAAVAAENPAWVAEVTLKIFKIKNEQSRLEKVQQAILLKAQMQLRMQTYSLTKKMHQLSNDLNQIWQFYIKSLTVIEITHNAQVAVVRDSAEPAPIYELAQDYQTRQSLAYRWHSRFKTQPSAQNLLNGESQLEMSCNVTAVKERNSWRILINVAKF